ncbi:CBO0543 family protein [Oceanobacillus oncorhynchi]|uniref:CBO0543 family protein n=1 Tax=Oceanobacillus oncorhynchi TaxID=545501 RepID=UPI0005AD1714|nr:CBO0543 family protein [Oceanobacillus oncorhynchi]
MKNTAKQWKKSSLSSLQKRRPSSDRSKEQQAYVIAALFSSIVGTYLDLFFVGIGMYHFPMRLFPEIFTVNIAFTLLILPVSVILFLYLANRMRTLPRCIMILTISTAVIFIEKTAEKLGGFMPHPDWNHAYSFFGYMLFLMIVWIIFRFFQVKI